MYHSLTFEKSRTNVINTWDQWNLIPSSRPVFAQPTPTYKYVDIPGRDGQLDLSDYLLGSRPVYSDRKGQFDFYVANNGRSWLSKREEIAGFLDGTKMKCRLENDVGRYYYGRFFLKEWKSEANFSHVIIEYQVDPYWYYDNGTKGGL